MKSYNEYMPKKQEEVLVQAKVDKELHEKVKAVLEKEGWTWHEFVNGLLNKYLDDNHKRRVG